MNSNYDLSLTCNVIYKIEDAEEDFQMEFYFDPYNDCTDMDGLKEMALLELEANEDFPVQPDGIDEDLIFVEITEFGNVHEKYANDKDIWDFAQAFAESEQDIEVVMAALDCDVQPSDIDEAYQGEYKDDEDFAYEMAMSMGAIDKNASWPNDCIDWEKAARELMYDYSSSNGYYFRSL